MIDVPENPLLDTVKQLHRIIRDTVLESSQIDSLEELSSVAAESPEDTIYNVDVISDDLLITFCEQEIAPLYPIILIAEGITDGMMILPRGTNEDDALFRIIVDPIDGTRGLMYQKRSAWILTGVAPNKGSQTSLQDIELAVQTEIPLLKQHLTDTLWAIRGGGAFAERENLITHEIQPLSLRPSRADTIAHGFVTVSRFFPSAREILSAIDDELAFRVLGPPPKGKALYFEDQYISTGGQIYEMLMGHDRFIADIRPLLEPSLREQGRPLGLCCHPYDASTFLIAEENGVVITDALGGVVNPPLDVTTPVDWLAYANPAIWQQVAPVFRAILNEKGYLSIE
ncbi:MAG: hypothetical protein JXA19_03140 [Anaerolineales bacterium]|nr:hypothetical protein [Anaerolineales bacterium]